MDKNAFQNTLKHGPCDGSREFLSTKCRGENAGTKVHACPLDSITPGPPNLCNCCDECTTACQWTTNIKKKGAAARRQEMVEVTEYLDNE